MCEENRSAEALRAAMRLELNVCTCHWMTHPPSQLAASPGGGNAGRGGAGAAAEGRDRPVLAALALLLLPPLCAMNQL